MVQACGFKGWGSTGLRRALQRLCLKFYEVSLLASSVYDDGSTDALGCRHRGHKHRLAQPVNLNFDP